MTFTETNGDSANFNVLDQSEIWFQVLNFDGRILYLNEYAEKLCGYTLTDFNDNFSFWEKLFRTQENGLRILALYRNMIRRGKDSGSNITEIISRSGESKYLNWRMKCIRNAEGNVTSAFIVGIDHTDNYGANNKKLVSREHRYQQIFRNAPIGFFRSLPEGRFIEVNNALAEMLGYNSPEDVLKNIASIGKRIYLDPDFRNVVIDETLKSGNVRSFETKFVNVNGEAIDVRINVSPRYDDELGNYILEGTIENISSRKEAENLLNQNLLKYATLFKQSPISLWEIDYSELHAFLKKLPLNQKNIKAYFEDHPGQLQKIRQKSRVIDVNQATLDLFGVQDKTGIINMNRQLANNPLTDFELRSMQAFLNNETSFEFETEFKKLKTGKKNIIIRWVSSPETEKPYSRVLVSMIDITIQRAEQEALRKSKNELSSLLSSMDDLVFIVNKMGKCQYVAPTQTDFLLNPGKESEDKYLKDFVDPEFETRFTTSIRRSIEEKITVSIDFPKKIRNREFWFEAKISPLSKNKAIVVARDITDRISTDNVNKVMLNVARAVNTTDNLDDLFNFIHAEISKILDTKNFFIALFDATKHTLELPYFRDEKDEFDHFPAEKTLSELVIRKKRNMLLHEMEIMKMAEEGLINIVGSVARVWLGIPLMVEGEVLGLMVVQNYDNEDAIRKEHMQLLEMISPQVSLSIRRKQSEQKLRESEQQLRESNQTKDRFFNIIAHDLKNPFNAIIGFTSLLSDEWNEFDDEDKISMINSIKSSSENAYELLMNLLDWSRLQVGKISFKPEFIDLLTLVNLNFSLLRTAADKKRIKLISTGICNKLVWADQNMIKTVIRNLLTNAIKFTPENGTITVDCMKDEKLPGMVVMSIRDNGMGIPEVDLKQLFSLSNQASRTGTDGESGTGIGLILCKDFIEKNHGKIWAESETGKWSTFYIALPTRPLNF